MAPDDAPNATKRAEDALRKSEDRFQQVFNSSSNGMALTDLVTGRIKIGRAHV